MKKLYKIGLFFSILFFCLLGIAVRGEGTSKQIINVPQLSGDYDTLLADNSDRGLRLELNMDVRTGKSLWGDSNITAAQQLENAMKKYNTDKPQLAQVYLYLTGYKDKSLDDAAIENMNKYFDLLAKKGIKAVLRFAYIWDDSNVLAQEPKTNQVVSHIDQLAPWISKHRNQITVLQAGFIGTWGEWDSGARSRMNEKQILTTLLDKTPKDLQIQVRYLNIKNNNIEKNSENWNRAGYHDDFLIGVPHGWNTAGSNPNSADWKQMTEESKNLLIDGEMIWGSANATYVSGDGINGLLMAKRLAEQHFTSLSITHNYTEGGKDKPYSMVNWQSEFVNQRVLEKNGLPYQPEWFIDQNGNNIPRSLFEYIKQYLGYRIAVESGSYNIKNNQLNVSLKMKNYGFAAPLALDGVYVVLLDENNHQTAQKEFVSKDKLQSMQDVEQTISFSSSELKKASKIAVHLKNRQKDKLGNRLSNDITFENGFNILVNNIKGL